MPNAVPNRLAQLREQLDALIFEHTQPFERRIAYGNLRREFSDWGEGDQKMTNIAVIYETPGGSTAQINVTYSHAQDTFCLAETCSDQPTVTSSVDDVIEFVKRHVDEIPQKRLETLKRQVEIWNEEGKSRGEIFAEMNKLLQLEFVGGRITNVELREAINYAIRLRGGPTPGP